MTMESPPPAQVDALLPAEIARKAEEIGVAKANMDTVRSACASRSCRRLHQPGCHGGNDHVDWSR